MFASATAKARRLPPSHELWIPHKYQTRAVKFLLDRGAAALFLDPGLGKTSITLEAFRQLKKQGIAKKMLVIAPLRVCQLVWEQEARGWTQFRDLKFTMLHGPNKKELLDEDSDIFLINPEGVQWLATQFWGGKFPFDTVTIDELTKFKNAQAVRHKALLPRLKGVMRIWGLTGTPIPNGYMDLFGQMKILDGGAALGQWFTHFRNKYFEKGYDGFSYTLRRGAAKAIEETIAPYVLRMDADDYLEMPKLIDVPHPVVLSPKARMAYDKMKKDMIVELGGEQIEAGNAAAVYSKLKQMGNGAVYAGDGFMEPRRVVHLHDDKIESIMELIEELQGTPLLVGYEFNHDLTRLRKAIGEKTPYIGSGVSGKEAQRIEQDWNAGRIPVLLAHPASAGHGLNLQKGNAFHLAWFSCTWDYELYDQFIRRIMRQGNKATRIFNHVFIVENSIDIKTRDVISGKKITQGAFFDALNAEIYQDGKTVASPEEADSTEEDNNMAVRKLGRKDRKAARESQIEDDQDVDNEEEEDEEESKTRRTRRTKSETKKPSRRTRRADKEADEDDDDDGDDDDDDDDDKEPIEKKARRKFSKAVQAELEDDDDDADEEDEDEDEDEAAEAEKPEEKPKRSRRTTKSTAKSTEKPAETPADLTSTDMHAVCENAVRKALESAQPSEVPGLIHAYMDLNVNRGS